MMCLHKRTQCGGSQVGGIRDAPGPANKRVYNAVFSSANGAYDARCKHTRQQNPIVRQCDPRTPIGILFAAALPKIDFYTGPDTTHDCVLHVRPTSLFYCALTNHANCDSPQAVTADVKLP